MEKAKHLNLNSTLHKMLKNVLVEIRASNDFKFSSGLADTFHNLPMMLLKSESNADDLGACKIVKKKPKILNGRLHRRVKNRSAL